MDIYGAVNRAIAYHPDITESLGGLFQQKELVNQARANYLPQVSSGLSSGYRTTTERTDEAFNVNVSQLLYDFGKVSSTVDAAEFGVVRDRAAVLMSIDDLARDTARAFIEVLRYKELLDIANSFVSAVGDIQDLAAKRSEKGASSRSDEIQAKSRKHSAEATAMQYRSRLDVWLTTLENLVGADANIDVAGDFPDELNSACTRATENFDSVPLIVMAEAEKAIAKANIKNAKAEILPTISLNADYDHYLNQGGDNALADDEYFTFTLDLRSKLYQGGALSARRRSAEYALNRAIASKKSALLDVERSLRESKVQSRVLSRRMKSLDARYDDIVKTQELYRKQYLSLGTRTLLDILNTEAEIYQSLFDIKNNFYELERLQIDCLHSISGLRSAFSINENLLQGVSINP
ncbi:MAG: type I secretion protein TolC [Gammaproteobacteria bacterium]|nr:MAG: type I secretion protein TolC [Gammaproteobacteria bacterium]